MLPTSATRDEVDREHDAAPRDTVGEEREPRREDGGERPADEEDDADRPGAVLAVGVDGDRNRIGPDRKGRSGPGELQPPQLRAAKCLRKRANRLRQTTPHPHPPGGLQQPLRF